MLTIFKIIISSLAGNILEKELSKDDIAEKIVDLLVEKILEKTDGTALSNREELVNEVSSVLEKEILEPLEKEGRIEKLPEDEGQVKDKVTWIMTGGAL